MKRRGMSLLGVVAAMSLGVTACGSDSKEAASTDAASETTAEAAPGTTEAEAVATTGAPEETDAASASSAPAPETSAAAAECETDGLTEVKVSVLGIYTDGVITLAEDKCYFAEAGISVTLTVVPAPPASVAALTGGEVDIAYAPSVPLVRAVANGAPLQALAAADGYTQEAIDTFGDALDDTGVFVTADSAMTSPKDLEGKTVAVPARGAQLEVTTADAVLQAGGDPSKVNFVELDLPNMVDALKAGEIDAAALVSPFSDQAKAEGMKLLDANGVGFFGPGAVGLWLTTGDKVESMGDTLNAFRTAIYRANDDATDNPEEFWPYIASTTGIGLDVIEATGINYVFPSELTVADLDKVAAKLVALGFIEAAPDLSAAIVP